MSDILVNLGESTFIWKESLLFWNYGAIFSLDGKSLKLDQFGSNISSTESDVHMYIWKAWTVTDGFMTT